jgi:hypothetical protein
MLVVTAIVSVSEICPIISKTSLTACLSSGCQIQNRHSDGNAVFYLI